MQRVLTTQSLLLLLPATPFFLLSPGCGIWQHHPSFPESSLHRTPPPSRLHPMLTRPISADEIVLRAAVSSHHHSFFIQQLLIKHLLYAATMLDMGSATANKACPWPTFHLLAYGHLHPNPVSILTPVLLLHTSSNLLFLLFPFRFLLSIYCLPNIISIFFTCCRIQNWRPRSF